MRATGPTAGRMGVRASKATALAAMQQSSKAAAAAAAATASSSKSPAPVEPVQQPTPPPPPMKVEPKEEDFVGPHPSKNSVRRATRLPTAPPLDFSTLRMSAPRIPNPPPRERPRMFDLEEAPVYHPTIEQFSQPMEYIERIARDAKDYGICKIVPPEGWRPPFSIDTEVGHCAASLSLSLCRADTDLLTSRPSASKLACSSSIRSKLPLAPVSTSWSSSTSSIDSRAAAGSPSPILAASRSTCGNSSARSAISEGTKRCAVFGSTFILTACADVMCVLCRSRTLANGRSSARRSATT